VLTAAVVGMPKLSGSCQPETDQLQSGSDLQRLRSVASAGLSHADHKPAVAGPGDGNTNEDLVVVGNRALLFGAAAQSNLEQRLRSIRRDSTHTLREGLHQSKVGSVGPVAP
jgi:hypothetical protein